MAADFELPDEGATLDEIRRLLKQSHDCNEERFAELGAQIKRHASTSMKRDRATNRRIDQLKTDITAINDPEKGVTAAVRAQGQALERIERRLGLGGGDQDPETVRPGLLAMPWPMALWRLVLIIGPLMAAWNLGAGGLKYLAHWAQTHPL
jgi:hypothetical protein